MVRGIVHDPVFLSLKCTEATVKDAEIARDLTAAEEKMKAELEGKDQDNSEESRKEEAVKTYQVVSGDMFTRLSAVIRRNQNDFSVFPLHHLRCDSLAQIA